MANLLFSNYRLLGFGGVTIVLPALFFFCSSTEGLESPMTARENRTEDQPFALVELFTSQGCSSCPPADANLARLAKSVDARSLRVIPLSFHVDYWNRLGWKDPFSSSAYSARQSDYARVSREPNLVYTPQMIVNGEHAFNGSNERFADQAIRISLQQSVKYIVRIKDVPLKNKKSEGVHQFEIDVLPVDAKATSEKVTNPDDLMVNIVTAKDSESVHVKSGENDGRTLSHVWVVTNLETRPISSQLVVDIPSELIVTGHTRLVVFAQSKSSRRISGLSVLEF